MSLQHLENVVNASAKVASLDFPSLQGRVDVLTDRTAARGAIRDAFMHERKLFTMVDEGGVLTRPQFEPPTPLRGAGPLTVERLIRGANVLAQICGLADAKKYIATLNQRNEEITSSIDSLESILQKQEINLGKLKTNEKPNPALEEEIKRENMEIFALEALVKENQDMNDALDAKLYDQRYQAEEARMSKQMRSADDEERKKLAERVQELETLRQVLDEIESKISLLDEAETERETEDTEFGRLKARYNALVRDNATRMSTDALSNNKTSELSLKIHTLMTTAEDELEKLMEDRRKYDLLDCDVDVLAEINSTITDHVAAGSYPDINQDTTTNLSSTSQIILCAIVLQIIRDANGIIPLASLKEKIGQAAREQGLQESQGVSAVYMLVANRLISIDRLQKDNPVKADMWITNT